MLFHNLSEECYFWLKKQHYVKEESLTDWLLYQASLRSDKVFYKTFSRHEEASVGADWEWWILTEDKCGLCAYRLLIQAKKLKSNKDNYSAVTYGNKNGMQIDLLINSAISRQAFPLYVYYSCTKPDIKKQILNFSYFRESVIKWCKNCTNGVYLSSAESIRRRVIEHPRRKISDNELIDNSLGLSMLDLLFQNNPGGFEFLDAMDKYYLEIFRDENKPPEHFGIKYSSDRMPNYIKSILEYIDKDDLDWFENEFHRDLNGLSGIAIIDTRQ